MSTKKIEHERTCTKWKQKIAVNLTYTWILLIVEISTPKPKSINFAKFKRKRTPERLFPLQNAFFNSRTLTNGFERFFDAIWTVFERFFPLQNVRSVRNGKILWCSFFHTNPQNRSFLGLELKKIQYLEAPGMIYGKIWTILCINAFKTYILIKWFFYSCQHLLTKCHCTPCWVIFCFFNVQ